MLSYLHLGKIAHMICIKLTYYCYFEKEIVMKKTLSAHLAIIIANILNIALFIGANTASTVWRFDPAQPKSLERFKKI